MVLKIMHMHSKKNFFFHLFVVVVVAVVVDVTPLRLTIHCVYFCFAGCGVLIPVRKLPPIVFLGVLRQQFK